MRPSPCSFSTSCQLVGRLDLAVHLVDAEALAHRARRRHAVARGHHDAEAGLAQRRQRIGRGCLDRIGHREQTREARLRRPDTSRSRPARARLRPRRQAPTRRPRLCCINAVLPSASRLPAGDATHADARRRVELLGPSSARPAVAARRPRSLRRADARCPDRGSRRGADTSSSVHPAVAIARSNVGRPSVSVPVLSTMSVSTLRRFSMAAGVAEQDAVRRAAPGGHHDRHRRRQSQRAGAGDDQHGDRVDQP